MKFLASRFPYLTLVFIMTLTLPGISPSNAAVADYQVTLVNPTVGSTINPFLPFTITLRFTGGSATTVNHCYDSQLKSFSFGAQAIDSANLGYALGWYGDGYSASTGDAMTPNWTANILSNGIECSLAVNSSPGSVTAASFGPGLTKKDIAWFGTPSSNWSGSETNYGSPVKIDIAWSIADGPIQHHIFTATTAGNPSVNIVGLTRGVVIDYQKQFQVVATMSKLIKFNSLKAGVDIQYLRQSGLMERVVSCPSNAVTSQSNGDLITYTVSCSLKLWQYPFKSGETMDVIAYLSADRDYKSKTITVTVGKIGLPQIQATGTLKGNDVLKPWNTPATLNINGIVCADINLRCYDSDVPGLVNILVTMCVDGSCFNGKSDATGKFAFNVPFNRSTANWKVTAKVNDFPALYFPPEKSDYIGLESFSDISYLPKAPPKPLTPAQIKERNKSLYNYGVKLMGSLTSTELISLGFLSFYLPGKSTLTLPYAKDFCSKLPQAIPGLSNLVGVIPDINFVNGCASVAIKNKLKR